MRAQKVHDLNLARSYEQALTSDGLNLQLSGTSFSPSCFAQKEDKAGS